MSAYGTGGIVILMTDWNNSTEATGDGGLMCSHNPTVHTLHTPIGHSEGSAKSDSNVLWWGAGWGVEGEHDGGGPKI